MKSKALSRRGPLPLTLVSNQLMDFQYFPVGGNETVTGPLFSCRTVVSIIASGGRLATQDNILPPIPLTYDDPKSRGLGILLKFTLLAFINFDPRSGISSRMLV